MLYITIDDGNRYIDTSLGWHTGEQWPDLANPDQVTKIQAYSDELEVIRRLVSNIPSSTMRVQTWYGDHAKFIANTLHSHCLKMSQERIRRLIPDLH